MSDHSNDVTIHGYPPIGSGMTEVRLVPMTRVQRDLFVNPQVPGDREAVMRELITAWDASPALGMP